MTSPDPRIAELLRIQSQEAPPAGLRVERVTRGPHLPASGATPESDHLLARLYDGEWVAREKKPFVVCTRRSWGPYLVSVDADAVVLLDACSQIATLTHGFANGHVLRALHDGDFTGALLANPDVTVAGHPVLQRYAQALLANAPAGLSHAAFVAAGGAEANEKAFRIARQQRGGAARRVLAFEGSFHGRTLVSLMATYNPVKRGPFEVKGYEAVFCPRDLDEVQRTLDAHSEEIFSIIVEPMQAEGGDIHPPPDFYAGLVQVARSRGIPLIVDEVQTAFSTGGPFYWWQRLGLGSSEDTAPDLLTLAKKAGLGVVLSRWPDPEPTEVNVASALRGLIQQRHADEQRGLEPLVGRRLEALRRRFPLVSQPRAAGTTFAFDPPSKEHVARFIAQRFARGMMTYQAGATTIRFRLGATWTDATLDALFERIAEALEKLDEPDAATWPTRSVEPESDRDHEYFIRTLRDRDWPSVLAVEAAAYEKERQSTEAELRRAAEQGCAFVAVNRDDSEVLGFCFAAPLEVHGEVDGPRQDETLGRKETLYSVDLTVADRARGLGVGRELKHRQLAWAQDRGYRYVSGRNRVGVTDAMMSLNRSLGAFVVARYPAQYGGDGVAEYYRIPLGPPRLADSEREPSATLDLSCGIQSPLGPAPECVAARELAGPLSSKLNLSNWATLDAVHYMEYLRAIRPAHTPHGYVTSSRDEMVDKALRGLRVSRPGANIAVGLEGGYVGHVTSAARSISDPTGFAAEFGHFDWPRVPHPARAGIAATLEALERIVEAHGADALFGLIVEAVGERSGEVLDAETAGALQDWCRSHGLPFVWSETSTGGYRGGQGCWRCDALGDAVQPDLVLWYPGGQLGHVFAAPTVWVDKPLTLISTWDGDEVCMIRAHEALKAAAELDFEARVAALDELAAALAETANGEAKGLGLYRAVVLKGESEATQWCERIAGAGVQLRRGAPGVLLLVPALDVDPARVRDAAAAVRELGS